MADTAFQACYRCGTGAPGAATLELRLVVSPPWGGGSSYGQFSGMATVSQATSPPVNLHVQVHGFYDSNSKTIVAPFGGGAPGGTVSGHLILPVGWGQPGECQFVYSANGKYGTPAEGPAEPMPC